MRIDPKNFSSFRLVGYGWSVTISNYGVANQSFNKTSSPVTLYGIKSNGDITLIDQK